MIEIGTEELPPTALMELSRAFTVGVTRGLADLGIGFAEVESFSSPRRLAILIRQVETRQPDQESIRRGPAIGAAFGPDGSGTAAAVGFARSCGVEVSDLDRERTDKGEWLVFRRLVKGAETVSLVPQLTEKALADLPIPKRMRWGDGDVEFVRPIHWVCLLFGDTPIAGRVLGVEAQAATRGHRFHHPETIALARAGDYPERLREPGRVEPSFERRRAMIRSKVEGTARDSGLIPEMDPSLLDEVTALVEWPYAVLGRFDDEFLAVPPEVLIETMRKNQKYFPLRTPDGALASRFIAIANIDSRIPEEVRAGNERVIRPRFADAKFFWEQDLKHPLAEFFPRLETVVFQDKLGTLAEKSRRITALATALASKVDASSKLVERAAMLSKCDLVSTMVYEFPALQGTMGRYYAAHSGEDACVCDAMEEQYLPRFAGDRLPASPCGRLIGIADRIDTLVGIFGIGLRPSGAKDPYGLRRASIAVLRILIETPLAIDLREAIGLGVRGYPTGTLNADTVESVLAYALDRLPGYYQEQGIESDTVEAVLATGDVEPHAIDRRIHAVDEFRSLGASASLASANKRIRNILVKAELDPMAAYVPDPALFSEAAEKRLWNSIQVMEGLIAPLLEKQDFKGVLDRLGGLREDVDDFFDQVMVMTDNLDVRRNRQALLGRILGMFLNVADISKLH
ncbi:MAG: glycine--tRNA ligase subunit beta [Chromatiaceae bacterium]